MKCGGGHFSQSRKEDKEASNEMLHMEHSNCMVKAGSKLKKGVTGATVCGLDKPT